MNAIELSANDEIKGGEKMKKLIKNNKGFSLVELLIVIAIMGVLAVIAFNMFGGVLNNSKQRADEAQAHNIQKALLTYCIDSGDWSMNKGIASNSAITLTPTMRADRVVVALMDHIKIGTQVYGPYLTRKDANQPVADPVNVNAYLPQYNPASGGTNESWDIDIFVSQQNIMCAPTTTNATISVIP